MVLDINIYMNIYMLQYILRTRSLLLCKSMTDLAWRRRTLTSRRSWQHKWHVHGIGLADIYAWTTHLFTSFYLSFCSSISSGQICSCCRTFVHSYMVLLCSVFIRRSFTFVVHCCTWYMLYIFSVSSMWQWRAWQWHDNIRSMVESFWRRTAKMAAAAAYGVNNNGNTIILAKKAKKEDDERWYWPVGRAGAVVVVDVVDLFYWRRPLPVVLLLLPILTSIRDVVVIPVCWRVWWWWRLTSVYSIRSFSGTFLHAVRTSIDLVSAFFMPFAAPIFCASYIVMHRVACSSWTYMHASFCIPFGSLAALALKACPWQKADVDDLDGGHGVQAGMAWRWLFGILWRTLPAVVCCIYLPVYMLLLLLLTYAVQHLLWRCCCYHCSYI